MALNIVEIVNASGSQQFDDARALILEYAGQLGFDLAFQNFDAELVSLPTMYNTIVGGLWVAYLDGMPVGVIGLRRFSDTIGEVKRTFVRETARGHGIGKLLLLKVIEKARALNYQSLKLDTTDAMKSAIKLYTDNGFEEIPSYRYNPQDGARYFELRLNN